MLVLSRKKDQSIIVNGNIRIDVLQIKGNQIRLGISAPPEVKVLRGELTVHQNKSADNPANGRHSAATPTEKPPVSLTALCPMAL